MLVHTWGGKCWLKTDADDCFIVLFCFKFMAISVTAGPDCLEGPINRPHCVALELQKTWWEKKKKTLIVDMEVFANSTQITCEIRDGAFPTAMPRSKWGSVKTSAGVDGLPTPILPNKSLAAAATFGHKHQPPSTGDRYQIDPCLETEYYVFPSLYHKYINYANYEHCILTKTHFLSPFRCCARGAGSGYYI